MNAVETLTEILKGVKEMAKPGVNLLELERYAESSMLVMGAQSANKGYQPKWALIPFPSVICLGVNDVISHPIPEQYILQSGDLLHIDCGISVDGVCADAGFTVPIGEISNKDEKLLRAAKRSLYEGIKVIKPGVKITDIGEAIYAYAHYKERYLVNQSFMGHGIGKHMHEEPTIPHVPLVKEQVKVGKHKYEYKELENIPMLQEGQIICLEPMLTYKDPVGKRGGDGWTFKTRDGSKSAFFEHMIKVTMNGYEILTKHFDEGVI